MSTPLIRRPAVAGQFYPIDARRLSQGVQGYMNKSGVGPAPGAVAAIVVPHAGYVYSGPTAGHAYARVKGKRPKRVVLLGCSHRHLIETASVYNHGAFDTPLGQFPVDEEMANILVEETGSRYVEPHLIEHSLEVQLPFLHEAIGEVPIVPILFGSSSRQWHAQFGQRLAELLDKDDLVVASTDLSHYLPESEATTIDKSSLEAVLKKSWEEFAKGVDSGQYSMCGAAAVATTMAYAVATGANTWTLLDYSTSAKTSGDYSRVVGYAAISMERES